MKKHMVVLKHADGRFEQLGEGVYEFEVPPRQGEYIIIDDENHIGQAYQIVAVLHPDIPTYTATELIVKYIDTDVNLRVSL